MRTLSFCIILLLSRLSHAQIAGFDVDDDGLPYYSQDEIQSIIREQQQKEQELRQPVVRRWPYGAHDRFLITQGVQKHFNDPSLHVEFLSNWHPGHKAVNVFSYFQPLGNGIANMKEGLDKSAVMKLWRKYIDSTAKNYNPQDRMYISIYRIHFFINSQAMDCYTSISKVGHKSSPQGLSIYRVSSYGCNQPAWKIEDQSLFEVDIEAED